MTARHRPGCSIVSGREVYAFAGDPPKPVRILPEATRATLILQDGSLADVTIHAAESAKIRDPAVLREAWARAWRTAREVDCAVGPNRTPEQAARLLRDVDALYSRPPIGVLCIRPMAEAVRRT